MAAAAVAVAASEAEDGLAVALVAVGMKAVGMMAAGE